MGLSFGNRRQDRDVLLKEKTKRQAAKKVEDAALQILAKQCENLQKKLIGNEIRLLLLYYQVERKDHGNTVGEARAKYMKLMEENIRSGPLLMRRR